MKFKLYEHVRIKRNGIIGQIIDEVQRENRNVYIVESDEKEERKDADYQTKWPLYDCTEEDLVKVESSKP